jgi:hypothetical protein
MAGRLLILPFFVVAFSQKSHACRESSAVLPMGDLSMQQQHSQQPKKRNRHFWNNYRRQAAGLLYYSTSRTPLHTFSFTSTVRNSTSEIREGRRARRTPAGGNPMCYRENWKSTKSVFGILQMHKTDFDTPMTEFVFSIFAQFRQIIGLLDTNTDLIFFSLVTA